jgi:UDP-3-O-[3-hydroxymyristoyl] glucosamine N-acyltransferase
MKLGEIAKRLDCKLEGDANIEIHGIAGITQAAAGQLTFVSNPRYRQSTRTTRASAVILAGDASLERDAGLPALAALRSANPYLDFARAMELFHQPPQYAPGIHPTAVIAKTAKIGEGSHVGPYCFVDEGAVIGKNAVLHSFVTIYSNAAIGDYFFAHAHAVVREGCRIGNRVLLQNGVIIGGDGFGFAKQPDGHWHKMLQTGVTVLDDDVEIQSNSCVDRATIGHTHIHRGAKLDNLVLVGHGAIIGEDTLLCGQVGLAGTTEIGKNCILGGQVGCSGHFKVGDGAMLTPQSGVPNDIPPGEIYSGSPAVEHRQWMKNAAALNQLPDLIKTVRKLQREIETVGARNPQV